MAGKAKGFRMDPKRVRAHALAVRALHGDEGARLVFHALLVESKVERDPEEVLMRLAVGERVVEEAEIDDVLRYIVREPSIEVEWEKRPEPNNLNN